MGEAPNKETPAHLEVHKNGTVGREKFIHLHGKRLSQPGLHYTFINN